jgi:hypothetical protein
MVVSGMLDIIIETKENRNIRNARRLSVHELQPEESAAGIPAFFDKAFGVGRACV